MEIKVNKIGNVVAIVLKGRIDASNTPSIEQELMSLISGGSHRLVADLSDVWFISSAGLRVLVAGLKEAKKEGGDLRLAGMQVEVQNVFDLTGLLDIFKVFDSREDAVQSYSDR